MFAEPPLTSQNKKPIVFGLPKMREKVLDMLGSAYSNNDLDIEEYEKRLAAAHKAQSIDELEHVIYDFPAVKTLFPTKTINTPVFPTNFSTGLAALNTESSFVNIIGNKQISSLDISEPTIELITGIGDTMLDLRDIGKKYTHIKITNYTLIGNLRIKLPANAQLKKGMSIVIGNLTQKVRGEGFWNGLFKRIVKEVPQISTPNPNPPIFVELSGFSLIGEVIVEYEKE
jgi:hypothetical protein